MDTANRLEDSSSFPGRKVPISLEDLKRMKEEKEAGESKPVFLTKAQRRALALKERESEVAAQKQEASGGFTTLRDSPSHGSYRSGRNDEQGGYGRTERGDSMNASKNGRGSDGRHDQRERDMELDLIRREKLGLIEVQKRKIGKGHDRLLTKITHWDDSEDTGAREVSSIYRHRAESLPQFGRGTLAGMGDDEDIYHHSIHGDADHGHSGRSRNDQDHHRRSYNDQDHHRRSYNDGGHGTKVTGRQEGDGRSGSSSHSYSWEKKPLSEMTHRDWRILREDFEISVKGAKVPNPIRSWAESGLPDWALRAIKDANYTFPTAIQRQAIPIGLEGRDMIGVAETGSGKTASFLLPLLVHISNVTRNTSAAGENEGPYACILAPTRELAMQIKVETDKFATYANCRTVLLIGGEDAQAQISELRRGCEIIVATTGRLVDLLKNAWLVLTHCHYVVLDEGDRMIDMGFEDQLLQILDAMPAGQASGDVSQPADKYQNTLRTTVLFSATMPPAIERIANKYLRNPATIYVGDAGKAVDRIKQNVEFCKSDSDKKRRLQELLLRGPRPPIIIFMNHKASCDSMGKFVERLGFSVGVLHAGKSQDMREWAITEFKEYRIEVLVATNVAGRGLDVKGVQHVINYDLPDSVEEYTHRIGRTGRAGADGLATSFLTQNDEKILPGLKSLLTKTNQKIPRELNEMLSQSALRPVH